jgi:hypothetical protein
MLSVLLQMFVCLDVFVFICSVGVNVMLRDGVRRRREVIRKGGEAGLISSCDKAAPDLTCTWTVQGLIRIGASSALLLVCPLASLASEKS